METIQLHSILSFSNNLSKTKDLVKPMISMAKIKGSGDVVCLSILAPRKFMRRRKKNEVFRDKEDELRQKNWRKLMSEIEESGSAVSVLRRWRISGQDLSRDMVLGTVVRFKQMKKWDIVCELLEWLRYQHWWDFSEMDFIMLMTAYGKQGEFNNAETLLKYMNENGYAPNVMCHTALMEAYGRSGQYNKAEAIFRRMQINGPEPSALTYQIILNFFVQGDKFNEAETIFEALLDDEKSSLKPDQKMFHMMIYMYRKLGNYDQARKLLGLMAARGVPQSTVTFNSLMSFETNYKEVSSIYDQMQRAGLSPDVMSYSLLISAYGKARREDEALAVFEEMLDAGVRPTRKAYNILLDAFAISGMVEEARTVFKSMTRDRCYPDLCSYTTMLLAYVNASDMEGAENFLARLKRDGLAPNVVTYGTLMKGYARMNDMEKLMGVYEVMRMQGIKPNQTIFTTLMDAHARNADFGSGVFWFKEMESSGCKADQKAKNVLLSLAKTPEEQAEAKGLAGHAISNHGKEKQLNVTLRIDEGEDSDEDDDKMEVEFPVFKASHKRSNIVESSNGQSGASATTDDSSWYQEKLNQV